MRAAPLLFLLVCLTKVAAPSSSEKSSPNVLFTRAVKYEPLAWMQGKDRFPLGATIFIYDQGGRRALVPQLRSSVDPAISFDGTRVLFAGKRQAHDHWQIWEMAFDSRTLRQVTSCPADCIRPLYLPEDRFVFSQKIRGGLVIKVGSLTGGPAQSLSYAGGYSLPSDILRDGRILFDWSAPGATGKTPEIYTVYSDGSGVESYRCDHGHARHSGKQLSSGDIVFASEHGLGRFTSALAHEVPIGAGEDAYADEVAELPNGEWLSSVRRKANGKCEISRWIPGKKKPESFISDDQANIVQPVVMARRATPNRHPSALHDWDYANLLCLNAYTSKLKFAEGSIAAVRVFTRNLSDREILLGSSTVEVDGSFYIRTPADRPLKLELLDSAGKILAKEAGWFWLRRGEQRICVGCHAGPETAPENAVPAVLLRSTIPADMTRMGQASSGGQ